MQVVRPFLARGNSKLGESVHSFDLPPVSSCPGSTSLCRDVCYATRGRFRFEASQERLQWCYEQSLQDDFASRMSQEIIHRGISTVRVHVSGDFYDVRYAESWLEVMLTCHTTAFFFYTRSWRVAEIYPVLEQMAEQENVFVFFSADDECFPEEVPDRVRVAYMLTHLDSIPDCDLVFADRSVRPYVQQLSLLCPHESEQVSNCSTCRHCFS